MPKRNATNPVEKLLQMQQKFKKNLPERLAGIDSSWALLQNDKNPNFLDLHLKIHSLVGAAGTFGASMVSRAARNLEGQINLLLDNKSTLDLEVIEQIEYALLEVRILADKWQPSSIPFIPEIRNIKLEDKVDWQSNVYLVDDDVEVANLIIQFLEKSGYKVFYYREIKEFEKEYKDHEKASAIIMDMSFNEGFIAGAEVIQHLSENNKNFPPVIFISVHDNIEARLAAAQAGASRYFTKPIDTPKLLNSLDKLTHRIEIDAYRILLVDDEKDVLDYYGLHLKEAGMDVLSHTNPIEAYRAIEYFKPEIIVLDLYMSECSGFDIAKVIRQDDNNAHIPIVFLSAELDVATHLSAMDLGGDDFLMKPVEANYFIQTITSRVKRARHVNRLNVRVREALRESEYRLVTLDQHAIISMTDISGTITFVNERFVKISGYPEEELIGRNHKILKSGKHNLSFYEDMFATISSGKIWTNQICNKTKQGKEYWVEVTIVPFMGENGLPYKYVSVQTDITKIKQSEVQAQQSEQRLSTQKDTLNALSKITDYVLLEEDAFFNIVTQRAAETLNVERVSIWLLDETGNQINSKILYDRKKDSWSTGLTLKKDDYPKYFLALDENSIISASNAHTHSTTSEFSKGYLSTFGIGAMLDIPIRRRGHLIGIICCEHVGGERNWLSDEQAFVSGLADLVSLNLESSDRRRVEQALSIAKENADKANKAKSDFLSSMSHEFRTPMNAISGFAQLIAMDANQNSDEITESNAKEILLASDHLLQLVNEILDLAKIEAGKVNISIEKLSCSKVVTECISLISSMMGSRHITLSYMIDGKNVSSDDVISYTACIEVDRIRIKQILVNLLSNAIKYNNDNGSIVLSFDAISDGIRISVADTGKGIPKHELKDLFKAFSRLGKENGNIEGTGIGLSITKNLVELMGGKIGVISDVNKGSTFWVEFPLVD